MENLWGFRGAHMIVRDGICYPDAPARHVKIVGAENGGDRLLHIRFDDGEMRLFDGHALVGEVFTPLASSNAFVDWKL